MACSRVEVVVPLDCHASLALVLGGIPYSLKGVFRMWKKIDWENQLGRRLKLRDLHVFFAVAARGSMAKAAAHLEVTAPTVSEVIADLEHALD
jgi:Bacterial regulatory helix-turn-helix protein, lysR family